MLTVTIETWYLKSNNRYICICFGKQVKNEMDKYISDIFGYVIWVFLMVILLATGVGMFTANQIPQRQQNIERTIATTGGLKDETITELQNSFGNKIKIERAVELIDKSGKHTGKWISESDASAKKYPAGYSTTKPLGNKSQTYGTRVDYVMSVNAINIGRQTIDEQDPKTHKTVHKQVPAFSIGEIKNLHSYGITLVK